MSENKNSTKGHEKVKSDQHNPNEGDGHRVESLTLDKIDALLESHDAQLFQSLKKNELQDVTTDQDLKINIGSKNSVIIDAWMAKPGPKKILALYVPFVPKLIGSLRAIIKTVIRAIRHAKRKIIFIGTHLKPIIINWLLHRKSTVVNAIKVKLGEFKVFSLGKKISFIVFIILTCASLTFIGKVLQHKVITVENELFTLSLDEWAEERYSYDSKEQKETFYESTRIRQNIFNIKKLLANIRPSTSSGPNPMAAMEFLIEGADAEAVVEIKDREAEFSDLFLRAIELMSFDQLSSTEGKKYLCEKLREEANKLLTKGKIRRVFIKTSVIKP